MGVPIIEEILTFLQSVITWFVQAIPPWAKAILALFMVMFLANWIVPVFVGFGMACTTQGQLYTLNSPLNGFEIISYRMFNDLSTNGSIDYTDVINRSPEDKSYTDWLIRFVPCWFGRNTSECSKGGFDYWRYQYPSNYSQTTIAEYNALVAAGGSPKYYLDRNQELITPKCDGVIPRLYLFNRVNAFDPIMWLLLTIVAMLIPLAIKWYEMNHIF
jgi:hypothetical protein